MTNLNDRLKFLDSSIQKQDTGSPDNFELCKRGETLRNHALKGGRNAGAYYKIGKVQTFDECIDLCCSSDCTLALYVKRNCYSVECESAQLCKPIRVHRAIKPSIFRRYRGKFLLNIFASMHGIVAIRIISQFRTGFLSIERSNVSISLFGFDISHYINLPNRLCCDFKLIVFQAKQFFRMIRLGQCWHTYIFLGR